MINFEYLEYHFRRILKLENKTAKILLEGGWRYYCNKKEVPVSEMKYRISKSISESKIWRFILNIEHDILARSNFQLFLIFI